ncbi:MULTISPECIES: hypothetical protein [Methylobacterium]|uniref:hypothetical protein n=1 Tax=Methylobacterium TaxID=407 RepID=UPI0011CA0C10|nr:MULTISPECIES: hypothetical protein [Methylobacterium]TXN21785.1 hypothetical protein FV217_13325 [Methylobacterium sp. WL9]
MSIYCFFKDFGGPLATVIGTIAAVTVTSIFAHSQATTAEAQARTASNKLKFDLFNLRFAAYSSA